MAQSRIETPREFFDHVVTPDVEALKVQSTDLRSAYHACTSLLSLRDWVLHAQRGKLWRHGTVAQTPFTGTQNLQLALEALDSRFAIVTDVANATKHMVLDPKRSRTPLYGNANTEIQEIHGAALGSGPLAAAPLAARASRLVVKIDNTYYDVLECVTKVYIIWENLMNENSW